MVLGLGGLALFSVTLTPSFSTRNSASVAFMVVGVARTILVIGRYGI